jgi:hypothetical protein
MAGMNWIRAYSMALLHHAKCLADARQYKRQGMDPAHKEFMGLVRLWADRARMYRSWITTL